MAMRFALPLLLALAGSASPAAAQDFEDRTPANQAHDREALRGWARCLVSRHTRQVNDLLAADFMSEVHDRLMRRLAEGSLCGTPGSIRANGVLIRGELAEQMLARRIHRRPLAQLTAYRPDRPAIAARVPSEVLALCTVREAPQPVSALLATSPASAEERSALAALRPQVAQCLPVGERATFNAAGLRAILALGAYRLALHNELEGGR